MTGDVLKIYSPCSTARLEYVAGVIFSDILGINYEIVTDYACLSEKPAINYSDEEREGEIKIIPAGLIHSSGIKQVDPKVLWDGETPVLFPSSGESVFPFDIFSASFYMLSRYEEYQSFHNDIHGRFPASLSLAFREGFLKLPVVDLWAKMLGRELSVKYPEIKVRDTSYDALMTFDVDQAFAYIGKGFLRSAGGFLNDVLKKHSNPLVRLRALLGRREDPYNLFSYMEDHVKRYGSKVIFFFPVGDRYDHDRNPSYRDNDYRALINRICGNYECGIHSSYHSSGRPNVLAAEMDHYREITGFNAKKCRQHWLLLNLPSTYRNFIAEGIYFDYTMGFADEPGFRAGIARPFLFYDLLMDQTTDLTVVPFQVMDGTLMQYKNMTPGNAINEIASLINITREVGGLFVSVWHNTSLTETDGWEGWRRVFEETLRMQKQ
jgi:hypothetical protein